MIDYKQLSRKDLVNALDPDCSKPQRVASTPFTVYDKSGERQDEIANEYSVTETYLNSVWHYYVSVYPLRHTVHCTCNLYSGTHNRPCAHMASVLYFGAYDIGTVGISLAILTGQAADAPVMSGLIVSLKTSSLLDRPARLPELPALLVIDQARQIIEAGFTRSNPYRTQAARIADRVEWLIEAIDAHLFELEA